ncbi:MAG: class I tRNA ligase family protein, partial [Chitinophagaceae bacterium]
GEAEHSSGALETNTMPGYAGSSWYFLRYMDPDNNETFCDRKVSDYWNQVDLYIGGTEHAVGHLLYSRMWTKVLFDLGHIGFEEPYKRLLNQGMIQGSSRFVYRVVIKTSEENSEPKLEFPFFVSKGIFTSYKNDELKFEDIQSLINKASTQVTGIQYVYDRLPQKYRIDINPIHIDVNIANGFELNIDEFRKNKKYENSILVLEDNSISFPQNNPTSGSGKYICGSEVEKMSKSKFNTVNPDDLVARYGADTFRMYEMFLGPVEMSKPWDTKGIEGVHRFLKKFWRLFFRETNSASSTGEGRGEAFIVTDDEPTAAELKVLHNTIKKIEQDTERFSFNTAVSGFMIATNELSDLKCHKRKILEPILILLAPYAPHIAAELYAQLRHTPSPKSAEGRGEVSVLNTPYPTFEEKYIIESSKEYPISINGKLRTTMNISLDAAQPEVEKMVLANQIVQKWLEGKPPKKIIFVKNKMVNVVV